METFMKQILFLLLIASNILFAELSANDIIEKVDKHMSSDTRIFESTMTIQGKRYNKTLTSKSYSKGEKKTFTEYLSPARDKGTKMLKLENQLWIYSPATDRTIQISGHLLRQSVMGSDLSYEDMMDDRKLTTTYNAKILRKDTLDSRPVYILELVAKVEDIAYAKRKIWIDSERFVPLKEELFAKSGQLLKQTVFNQVVLIEGRWFPKKILYKDMLKDGNGTLFEINQIQFNPQIPQHVFSKASLK
jgi:outer membrane lipoprotein-sorting protein